MDELNEKQLPEIRVGTTGGANYIGFRPDIRSDSDEILETLHAISPSVSDRVLVDGDGTEYRELGYRVMNNESASVMGNVALGMILGIENAQETPIGFSESQVKDMSDGSRLF